MRFSLSTLFATALTAGLATFSADKVEAGAEPFIGEIMMVGYTFCPRGWTEADGQLLAISQYTALFSLYGTIYGGDGRTTFGLPDLRGRVAVHTGSGPGLTNRPIGQKSGSESNTLTVGNLPPHTHSLNARSTDGDAATPAGNLSAGAGRDNIYGTGAAEVAMNSAAIGSTGSGQAVNNMQPYQVIRFCVALQGLFPSRN